MGLSLREDTEDRERERKRESVCLLRGCSKGSIEGVLRELKGCGEGVK